MAKKISLELGGQFKHNNIDTQKFKLMLERVFARPKDQMLLVFGAPGIGKTTIVYDFIRSKFGRVIDQGEFKKEGGINLVVLRTEDMDRTSFSLPGYDRPYEDSGRRAIQCPFGYIPAYKPVGDMPDADDPDYEEKCKTSADYQADQNLGRGLIFLDEINRCNPDAEDVIKNIIERKFCDGWHIGSGWGIVAAGNRMEDDPDRVHEVGTAFFNRFSLQYNYVPKYDEWRQWALQKPYMNHLILDWIKDNPEHFYYNTTCDVENNSGAEDKKFTTPRTWELACKNMSVLYMLKTGLSEQNRYDKDYEDTFGKKQKTAVPFNKMKLQPFDITVFSEDEIKTELSPLDPTTSSEFIKFLKMIQVIDIDTLKKEIWTKGNKAIKIQNRDGSSTVTAVENAVIKMCIDSRTKGMPQITDDIKKDMLKYIPTIEEVESLFSYLTNYSMSTAQMGLTHYFNVFKDFKNVFWTYVRMDEYEKLAKKGGSDRSRYEQMQNKMEERINEYGMMDYCKKFDRAANIIQDKWPLLLKKINWDE